jgi:O-antigen/teichoic acid export membrane protein
LSQLRKNTLILLLNNVLGGALIFCMSIVIGRGLGAEGLGQQAFIIAWIAPLTTLGDFGLNALVTREAARDPSCTPALLYAVTRTFPILSACIVGGAWLLVAVSNLSPVYTVGIPLAALLSVLDPWYGLYTALFRAYSRMTPTLFLNVVGSLAELGALTLAIQLGYGIIGVFAALVLVNIFQLAIAFGWWRASGLYRPYAGESYQTRRELLARVTPFTLSALIAALGLRANIFVLERIAGAGSVGLYSAAARFLESGKIIPNAFFGALYPALSMLAQRPAERVRLFRRAFVRLTVICIGIALPLSIAAPILLRVTYGEPFRDAAPILAVLAWALIPIILRNLTTLDLFSVGKVNRANVIAVAILIGQAALSAVLITQQGTIGAAWAVLITEVIGLIVLLVWNRRAK